MVENGFGHTEYWPPTTSKSRQKRRKFYVSEAFVLKPGANPKELKDSQSNLLKYLGANVIEGNPMSISVGYVNSHPV